MRAMRRSGRLRVRGMGDDGFESLDEKFGISVFVGAEVGDAGDLVAGVVYLWIWCSSRTQVTRRAQNET